MSNEKLSNETENPALNKRAAMPRFIPQPSEIEALMKEKLANRKINDEFGWTGEWRMSAKDVLDVIIDLQHKAAVISSALKEDDVIEISGYYFEWVVKNGYSELLKKEGIYGIAQGGLIHSDLQGSRILRVNGKKVV